METGKFENDFAQIVGHEQIKRSLQYAAATKKPSHAYGFFGMRGIGKRTMANAFAKALQCQTGDSHCRCVSCRAFDSGNHPDVLYIGLNGKKSLGVEEIRQQVVQKAASKQYQYQYKIFIIENADCMTVPAQNTLLKTLEEPPSFAVFLLLAENKGLLLSTILSRVAALTFRPLPYKAVAGYLMEKENILDKQADTFAALSQGSIGVAMEMAASPTFTPMREDVIQKLISLPKLDVASCMAMAKDLEIYKDSGQFLDMIYLWYRDMLAAKKTGDGQFIIQKDQQQRLLDQALLYSETGILQKLDAVWLAGGQLRQNAGFQNVLEGMLIKLKES